MFIRGGRREGRQIWWPFYSTKAPSSSVFDGSLARNGCPETSRATLSSLWASQIALWRGAKFEIARPTLLAPWPCQIALVVARCLFLISLAQPPTLGLSECSRCDAVLMLIVKEPLHGDLEKEVFYRELAQRSCTETPYRDLAQRALTEILPS